MATPKETRKNTLVDAVWLSENIHSDAVKVFDCSYHLPGTNRSAFEEFTAAHIPGAYFFDIDLIADTRAPLPHMLPTIATFEKAIYDFAISKDDTIICYDNSPLFSAARVWWMFRYFGFENIYILNGGLSAWKNAGYKTVDGTSKAALPTNSFTPFIPISNEQLLVNRLQIEQTIHSEDTMIIDARSKGRFDGSAPEPRPNLPSGHMPLAVNIPYQDLFTKDGHYKAIDALENLFSRHKIDLNRPVITSCGSGITACTLAAALSLLGKWDVAIYDGAWIDWATHYGINNPQAKMIRTIE
ncbi:sulfurtransferase [Kordiimonas sp. SCSIO 12610]|uniref:sulfurtransferase n=1 Tax=Kordiimonas sp. SCSIO 12610 TaxID=2829597 RepID=UPI00210C18D8|nr:rhodanese-like domain-containing protein [Kordiimonas sp. SCSIO 12610]UTW56634.1 hypothetical protein KFF44_06990 [Kordiimonas sp. SCSIO 12610]